MNHCKKIKRAFIQILTILIFLTILSVTSLGFFTQNMPPTVLASAAIPSDYDRFRHLEFDSTPRLQTTMAYTVYIPIVIRGGITTTPSALTCNPSNGSGGLAIGTHDITIAGRPATVIVGAGYDPSKPTYLAFYLHGDEGGYNFHAGAGNTINTFINSNSWIYVAPRAPADPTDDTTFPWDGRNGGDIAGNATLVKNVLDDMFAKYNVCRNILFGGSVSGGSWFYDIYFFPKNGGEYPAFMNLNCGAAGIAEDRNFFGSYDQAVALSKNADVVARSEFKYTIGTNDFLYNRALISVPTYTNLGFTVIPDYLQDVGHCQYDTGQKIRDYWQTKSATLNPPDK